MVIPNWVQQMVKPNSYKGFLFFLYLGFNPPIHGPALGGELYPRPSTHRWHNQNFYLTDLPLVSNLRPQVCEASPLTTQLAGDLL